MSSIFSIPPALQGAVAVTFAHQTSVERQKIGGELRSSLSSHLLRDWTFDFVLEGREAQTARHFFDTLRNEPLRIPDWTSPANIAASDGDQLTLSCAEGLDFRCHSVFLIDQNSQVGEEIPLSDYDPATGIMTLAEEWEMVGDCHQVYPVRIGRLDAIPSLPENGDDQVSFSLKFSEHVESLNSSIPWLAEEIYPTFQGRPVFSPLWKDGEESWESNISYEKKSFGVETGYQREREAKRMFNLSVLQATRAEVYGLVKFFDDRKGRADGFWLSSDRCNYLLTGPELAGSRTITLDADPFEQIRVGYSYLNLRRGATDELVKIETVTSGGGLVEITLEEPLTKDFDPENTAVSLLNYVRFSSDELNLSFATDHHATASLGFVELPHEYAAPTPSTAPIYLYRITGYFDALLTSYGVSVTSGGETFTPANINHGAISYRSQSIKSECTVDFYPGDPSHPINVFQRGYPVEPMSVTVIEIEANALDDQEIVYRGNVRSLEYGAKNSVKLKVGSPGDAAETEIPTAYIEPRCSRQFLAAGCNLSAAAFLVTGPALTVDGSTITADEIGNESTARGFQDWFLGGQIKIGTERRTIIGQSGSQVTVSTPFVRAVAGDEIEILPGCNRTQSHCISRFNNFHNYGGFPLVPPANPQLEAVRFNSTIPQGGKK